MSYCFLYSVWVWQLAVTLMVTVEEKGCSCSGNDASAFQSNGRICTLHAMV